MNTQLFLSRAMTGLFAAMIASGPLKADGGESAPIRFGGGLSIVNPSGDFEKFSKQSFGVSVFGERELKSNTALRVRVEYATFGEKKVTLGVGYSSWQEKGSANTTVAMLDYIHRFESHDKGFYAFGGAGFVQGTLKLKYYEYVESLSGSGFGFSGGLGYRVDKNLGCELSYTTGGKITTGEDDEYYKLIPANLPFNWISLSFSYRF
jgi:hypothetical protein